LLVDDEIILHHLIKRILKSANWDVELKSAFDGNEALALIDSFSPDLIILDVDLPKKTGIEVCRKVRDKQPGSGVKILMISGDSTPVQLEGAIEAGADDFLAKPFTSKELLQKINKVLPAFTEDKK